MKISIMNSVDHQQPFKHLTWSKQIVNWFNWSSNDSSDDGRGSTVSFGSKNSSSKTSVVGKRKLVPLAWQCKTSHCSINKADFGKTRDSRIKSPPIFSWFICTRLFLIPLNQIQAEREKMWRYGGH
jgi:hypothetical protein